MRILYICPHPNIGFHDPSGPGTHIREVVLAMESLGHEVKVFLASSHKNHDSLTIQSQQQPGSGRSKNLIKKIIGPYFFESVKDFFLLLHDWRYARRLEKVVNDFKPNLIYERYYFLCLSGFSVAKKHRVRYFLEVNAPTTIEKRLMSSSSLFLGLAKRYERKQILGCARLIVVSSALKQHFVNQFPSAENKVLVLPNAVRSDWKIDSSLRSLTRESLGISSNEITIGFVGSIFPYHGVDLLIESFAELADTLSSLKLLIVGDGNILPELKQLAEQLGLNTKIIFTGNVPHEKVNTYLVAMDIAVMVKSNWYGSPVKIFEYGAASLPMICPDTIPVRDVITDGEDALIVPPEKSQVVSALRQLIEDPMLRETMGKRFSAKVFEKHTWTKNVMKILDDSSFK